MGKFAQTVIRNIEAARTYEDISEWIWTAGDLIRKADNEGYCSGFEQVDQEAVSSEERTLLKSAALSALERNSDPLWTQSMLSVLSCTGDSDLKKLWIESLNVHLTMLKRANAIVYTTLIALREIDEPVFEGARSIGIADLDRNVAEAQKVLAKRGIRVPW